MANFKVFILFTLLFVYSLVEAVPMAQLNKIAARQDSIPEPCSMCCRLQRNFDRAQSAFTAAEERLADANEAFDIAEAELTAARNSKTEKDNQIRSLQALKRSREELKADIEADIEAEESPGLLRFLQTILRAVRRDIKQIRSEIRDFNMQRRAWVIAIEDAREILRSGRSKVEDAERGLRRNTKRKETAQKLLQRCLGPVPAASETTEPTAAMPAEPEDEMLETSPEASPEM